MKEIKLNNSDLVAFVDDEDFEIVSQYNWFIHKDYGYAVASPSIKTNNKGLKMHRLIYEMHNGPIPEEMVIDHISRDRLVNTISNLRLVTKAENAKNHAKYKSNTSGYIGVAKGKQIEKRHNIPWEKNYWRVQVSYNKKVYAKNFPFTEEGKILAARYRDKLVLNLYKEFAGELNFPDNILSDEEFTELNQKKVSKSGYEGIYYHEQKRKRKDGSIRKNPYWAVNYRQNGKSKWKYFPCTDKGLQDAIEFRNKMINDFPDE